MSDMPFVPHCWILGLIALLAVLRSASLEKRHRVTEYGETQVSTYPNHTPICFGIVRLLLPILLISNGAALSAQTLEIKLVDGRNGRPMVGSASYVNVWVGPERKEAIAIPTDRNGVARLKLTLDTREVNIPNFSGNRGSIVVDNPIVHYDETLRINARFALCGSGGSNYSWLMSEHFSTKQVLQQGYVSPNTCGKATASSKPGQVILFVRPLSWWEKLKQ
jgi:hypothetical protein